MKHNILSIFLLIATLSHLNAQESIIANRWNIKGGLSSSYYEQYSSEIELQNIHIGAYYGVLNFLEAGFRIGLSPYERIDPQRNSSGFITSNNIEKNYAPNIALQANLQILPLFIKANDFRFDVYVPVNYQGYWTKSFDLNENETFYTDYFGVGIGLSIYITKHIGLFGEYEFSHFMAYENYRTINYGITYKFK